MIIECKNCLKKFIVNDNAIPSNGRIVQCSICSAKWHQMPSVSSIATTKSTVIKSPETSNNEKSSIGKMKASDGKFYKFMGSQWAEILPSGKSGRLAKKKIGNELNIKAGKKRIVSKTQSKIRPSKKSEEIYTEKEKGKGMGVFSFCIVLVFFVASIILFLDTFKNFLIPFWPELDNYLVYTFEILNNIYFIIKDLFNNYK